MSIPQIDFFLTFAQIQSDMKVLRILAATAGALLLLVGCNRDIKTASVHDEGNVPLTEGSEASLNYSYDVEYLTGGVSREVMDRINTSLVQDQILMGNEEPDMDVKSACELWATGLVEGYQADTESFLDDYDEEASWMYNWEYELDGSFAGADPARHLQTYCVFYREYTGGAHGLFGYSYTVYDLTTGAVVKEEDLFQEGYEDSIAGLLFERVTASLEEQDFEDALMGDPYPNGNFSVDKDGVTWHFNPYEVAVYAAGVLEATLSWNELKPFLK